ncbi:MULTISPECIES: RNA polymerase sigma factor [Actinosynnema]|uniref:RNA polymerase sigma factor n=1 Tax=Actinosynnema TaxID=40566 RepID=UPI0020A55D71|nr:sigma factor-like helix-turn-helix DNA-binding protein [Actinosynnema pretiosum]MCP2099926.1 Sigma-70, region 4 [Actinosynnema pretiosum]
MGGDGRFRGAGPRHAVTDLQPGESLGDDGSRVPPDPASGTRGEQDAEAADSVGGQWLDDREDALAGELLAELGRDEREPDFDLQEEQDADDARSLARYLRLEQDRLLYQRMVDAGFQGVEYEILRGELAAYALPVIRAWIRRGEIFTRTGGIGRPLTVTDPDRQALLDVDERIGLACETVARALTLFHRRALAGTGWSAQGGASLTTYFVGACVAEFPTVFRAWQRERARWAPTTASAPPAAGDHGPVAQDPAVEVVTREEVMGILARMPDKVRQILSLMALRGDTQAEVARELGLTERAVEGRLYRHRSEFRRREKGRDR